MSGGDGARLPDTGTPARPGEPPAGRPPATLAETLTANLRPQPAIPTVLVFLLTVLLPVLSLDPRAEPGTLGESWLVWIVPVGLLVSCALAIAAGFCSLFPQAAWIALAALALDAAGPLPGWHRGLLVAGIAACLGMFAFQVYRVATGRFVPTITDPEPEPGD